MNGPITGAIVGYLALQLAGCEGKQKFPTFSAAARVAKRRRQKGAGVEPYRCRFCHGFHIGRHR